MSSAQGAAARGCSSYGVLDRLLFLTLRSLAEARAGAAPVSLDREGEEEEEGAVNPRTRPRGRQPLPSALSAPQLVRGLVASCCAARGLWQHLGDEHLHLQYVEVLALAYLTLSLGDKAAGTYLSQITEALRAYLSQGVQSILSFHRALLPVLAGGAPKTHP
ncbi:hypothetical protein EON64_21360, partial [archaeon]